MPRRARIAAQRNERDERTMDSPQRRRIPPQVPPPIIPPPQFNIHVPNPEPVSLILLLNIDNLLSKIYFKAQYHHLPLNLQQQYATLPQLLPARRRGRAPATAPVLAPVPASVTAPVSITFPDNF